MKHPQNSILITGATGFIGAEILENQTRIPNTEAKIIASSRFPDKQIDGTQVRWIGTEDIFDNLAECKAIIHSEVSNNNQSTTDEITSIKINSDRVLEIARAADAAAVEHLILFSTSHALDANIETSYAKSKRIMEQALKKEKFETLKITIVRLPPVYAFEKYRGNLSKLNFLPIALRGLVNGIIRSIFPIANVKHVADIVQGLLASENPVKECAIADPIVWWSPYRLWTGA